MRSIDKDEALHIIVKNLIDGLLDKDSTDRIRTLLASNPDATIDEIIECVPDIQDIENEIQNADYRCYSIESDEEEGSWEGPWEVTVYDACEVWLVVTIETDNAWFDNRQAALDHAYDLAHEKIITERKYISKYRRA